MEKEAQRPNNEDEPANGSATQTITSSNGTEEHRVRIELNLRPETTANQPQTNSRPRRGVQWTEDTIDNEHLGKKSSKKCCIFHKPKIYKEDGSSSSSSSSEDSDTNAYEKLPKSQRRGLRKKKTKDSTGKHGKGSCDGHDH